jgi:hypothetical protein
MIFHMLETIQQTKCTFIQKMSMFIEICLIFPGDTKQCCQNSIKLLQILVREKIEGI